MNTETTTLEAPAPTGAAITPPADETSTSAQAPRKSPTGYRCGGCGAPARKPFTYRCPRCPEENPVHNSRLWREVAPNCYQKKALRHD